MKITKTYLKQIIKEELEQEGIKDWMDKPSAAGRSGERVYVNQSDDSDYRSRVHTNRDSISELAGALGMGAVITSPLIYKMFSDLLAQTDLSTVETAMRQLAQAIGLNEGKRK